MTQSRWQFGRVISEHVDEEVSVQLRQGQEDPEPPGELPGRGQEHWGDLGAGNSPLQLWGEQRGLNLELN